MPSLMTALASANVGLLIESGEYTSTETGTGIDVSAAEGIAIATLNSSAKTAGTDPTLDVKLQSCSAVGGTYADIAGVTFSQVTTAALLEQISFNIANVEGFVRALATIGGTSTPTFDFGVTLTYMKKAVS